MSESTDFTPPDWAKPFLPPYMAEYREQMERQASEAEESLALLASSALPRTAVTLPVVRVGTSATGANAPDPWQSERDDILARFAAELAKVTGDGSKKRQAGEKPPWYRDLSHEGAVFSHLTKWKRGELIDPDSGAHPLVHAAWRLLAIACRESGNIPEDTDAN